MATATLTLKSQNRWLADGTTTTWDFNFAGGYLAQSHVKAYSLSPADVRTDYTLATSDFLAEFRVRIAPAVPSGHTLVIFRDSSNAGLPLVDFDQGAELTEETMDLLAKQSIFVSQETRDSYGLTTEATFTDLLAQTQAEATAAGVSASAAATSLADAVAAALAASNSASAAASSAADAAASAADLLVTAGGLSGLKVVPVYGLPDWTDITSALQAAATAGGRWYIPAGKFEWTSVNTTTNLLLVGAGDATHLRRKANTDPASPNGTNARGVSVNAAGIRVGLFDLQLDGNEQNQTSVVEPFGYIIGCANNAPTATQVTQIDVINCTLRNLTQAAVRADRLASATGHVRVNFTGNTVIDGRPGTAQGTTSVNGYGPDVITATDRVHLLCIGNEFIDTRSFLSTEFGRTAVRITFDDGTTNDQGTRVQIANNRFKGYGRGERGNAFKCAMTGGSGSGAILLPITLSGSAVATFVILDGGIGYVVGNVLAHAGGFSATVASVSNAGRVLTATIVGGGAGYTLCPRPDNDVGVVDFYARGRNLSITGNLFEDCVGTPIRGKTNCKQTIIAGNIVLSCETNPGINVGPNSYLDQQGRIIITHNEIEDCAGYGIAVVGNNAFPVGDGSNTRNYVEDVIVTNNIVRKVAGWNMQFNPVDGHAYRMRNMRRLILTDNIGEDYALNGININGGSGNITTNMKVRGNILENGRFIGIYLSGNIEGMVAVQDNLVIGHEDKAYHLEAGSTLSGRILTFTGNQSDDSYDYGAYFRYWDVVVISTNQLSDVSGLSRGFYAQDCTTTVLVTNNQTSGVTTPLFGGGTAQNVVHEDRNSWNPKTIYGTAAPTLLAWNRGDRIINNSPSAGGTEGWVCVTAGTPGTWKTFGVIAA